MNQGAFSSSLNEEYPAENPIPIELPPLSEDTETNTKNNMKDCETQMDHGKN